MDSDKAKQVSHEIESVLSEILPDLAQLLQHYQVSRALEIDLVDLPNTPDSLKAATCCFHNGLLRCACTYAYGAFKPGDAPELGLNPEQAQQLCRDVASKLSTILPRLSQSAQQTDEIFEVHFLIDPATANPGQPVVCKWDSDTSRGNILQCSNP